MNDNQLSKRLETAASYIKKGARLADIGSDHAYLPCHLAQKEQVSFAIAGEVVIGPYASAKKQIKESNVQAVVEARLGDGLAVIEKSDAIDTITICGMGGDLIARILDAGKEDNRLETVERLILQPNNGEKKLRQWLFDNNYGIISEEILKENDKIYEIIVAEPNDDISAYTEDDFTFGKQLRQEKGPVFVEKWQREYDKYTYILNSLNESQRDVSEKKKTVEAFMTKIQEEIA